MSNYKLQVKINTMAEYPAGEADASIFLSFDEEDLTAEFLGLSGVFNMFMLIRQQHIDVIGLIYAGKFRIESS